MNFAPLHIYSGYSFLNSGLTLEKIVSLLKKNNFSYCGLSDYNTLSSLPLFSKLTEKDNIKALPGLDEEIEGYLISFYAYNEQGYLNLLNIIHLASTKPLLIHDLANYKDGLIIIVDTNQEKFKKTLKENIEALKKILLKLSSHQEHFYLGLDAENEIYNSEIREFANKYTYRTVAFPFIQYAKKEDAITLKIVKAIENQETIEERKENGNHYFLLENELKHFYQEDELELSADLVKMSSFQFEKRRGELLLYKNDLGLSSEEYLSKLAHDGLKEKLGNIDLEHQERLNYELKIIKSMGYCDYFLIVCDYVDYAKKHLISVGPGRGSAAGSLVSYALGIVMVDPLKYGLMFERFLNPERQSMPDIDIDFSDIRRYEVIDYLKDKYGSERVAHIMTIQTIGAKQALRDIGRVYNIATREIDLISKKIIDPFLSLRDNYRSNKQFKDLIDSDKYYLDIVSLASKIEGLPRQSGLHAAGIVLNNTPLFHVVPTIEDANNGSTCTYEMNYLEEQGILKMDLLGLRNLTIIDNCLSLINQYRKTNLHYENIPFEDEEAIKLVASTKTMGVFQLESAGMKKAIETIKIESFEDVVALLALYRPGPMANIPSYAKRKAGLEKVTYFSPILKEILSPTYGIIVYQEQIMQIVRQVAGFSYGEADLFRRAISKKDSQKLASLKNKFIKGAENNHFNVNEAEKIFALIYRFADYGFNRSHSLSYAILAMQMAYLKAHYAPEFYAAILENTSGNNDSKFNEVISEMKSLSIAIQGPNINESNTIYTVNNNKLLFSLASIKGISYPLAEALVKERQEHGSYTSFLDFLLRNASLKLSIAQVNCLIDAGAFDTLDKSRASLRASTVQGLEYANMMYQTDGSLFNNDLSFIPKPTYVQVEDNLLDNLNKEYLVLGIMVSGSPLSIYGDKIKEINHSEIIEVISDKKIHTIIGIINSVKRITTKKNHETMAFISLYDNSGQIEVTIFPKLFNEKARIIEENNIVKITGKMDANRDGIFVADEISLLEDEHV